MPLLFWVNKCYTFRIFGIFQKTKTHEFVGLQLLVKYQKGREGGVDIASSDLGSVLKK